MVGADLPSAHGSSLADNRVSRFRGLRFRVMPINLLGSDSCDCAIACHARFHSRPASLAGRDMLPL